MQKGIVFYSILSVFIILSLTLFANNSLTGNVINESTFSLNRTVFLSCLYIFLIVVFFVLGSKRLEEKVALQDVSIKGSQSERQREYIEKYTPDYLKSQHPGFVYNTVRFIGKRILGKVDGKDKLPDGPKLFILNHRKDASEGLNLLASLDKPIHLVVGEKINWTPIRRYFFKKIGAIPIRESLSHLGEKDKIKVVNESLVAKRAYQELSQTDRKGLRSTEYIRNMTSMLLKGEDVGIFVEGPLTKLKSDERRAYAGYALVAREYKKLTGKDLPIVPVGVYEDRVSFGDSFSVDSERRNTRDELEEMATKKVHHLYDTLRKAKGK